MIRLGGWNWRAASKFILWCCSPGLSKSRLLWTDNSPSFSTSYRVIWQGERVTISQKNKGILWATFTSVSLGPCARLKSPENHSSIKGYTPSSSFFFFFFLNHVYSRFWEVLPYTDTSVPKVFKLSINNYLFWNLNKFQLDISLLYLKQEIQKSTISTLKIFSSLDRSNFL